jgi:hypothetical protein
MGSTHVVRCQNQNCLVPAPCVVSCVPTVHWDVPLVIAGCLATMWNLCLLPGNLEALLPAIPPAIHALKKHRESQRVSDPGVTLLHHLAHRVPDVRVLEGAVGPVKVRCTCRVCASC